MIGYNRPKNMRRLFDSLMRADYGNDAVDLLISIDNSGTDAVEKEVSSFDWKQGEKKIFTYPERMGLRKHILSCGRFLDEYDALAVLEDDLAVSPAFYQFMKAAVEKYGDDDRIAGISLYTHLWNHSANYPFIPAFSAYDVYFFQMAQSWGQVWMKKQWAEFMKWYGNNSDDFPPADNFPDFITGWSKSWLKYHNKFCVETDRYFVYPYGSCTTCFGDAGEHSSVGVSNFQVPMMEPVIKDLRLPEFGSTDAVYYDIFYERQHLAGYLGLKDEDLTVDFYGLKAPKQAGQTRYLLTVKAMPYQVVKSFALSMRPQETNVIYQVAGNDVFLYDTTKSASAPTGLKDEDRYTFYHRVFGNTKLLTSLAMQKVKENVKRKIKR